MTALTRWGATIGAIYAGVFALATLVEPAKATESDTLVIGKSGDPDLLDPAVTVTNDAWTATYPAYERLVRFKVENGKGSTDVEGELAKSWEASPDGKVFTFTLYDGHKFADGSPVNAQAVKFSFERLLKIAKGPSEPFEQVAKVDAIDDHTVQFTLKAPFAPFLSTLVDDGGSIVSPEIMKHETNGDLGQAYLADHSMGSGAFQVTDWEKGQQIVMEPNPNFSGKKPAFKKVVIKIIKEASARQLQLEKGDLDIAEDIPVDQLNALKSVPRIIVVDEPSFLVTYLYLNNTRPPLDNPKVRQALSYAIDYKGIIDGILLGQGVQMRGAIPVGMWGHDPAVMQVRLRPEEGEGTAHRGWRQGYQARLSIRQARSRLGADRARRAAGLERARHQGRSPGVRLSDDARQAEQGRLRHRGRQLDAGLRRSLDVHELLVQFEAEGPARRPCILQQSQGR